jgi:ribosome modulation factor
METCKLCETRQRVYSIQMEGRQAVLDGKKRTDNPYRDPTEKQYWEYGWIEESFVSEIEEHRAIMDWTGVQLYSVAQYLQKLESEGRITPLIRSEITDVIETVCGKLAEKLEGN